MTHTNPRPQAALDAHGLRFAYPDGPEVLRGLDLRVDSGERVGLIGPNGAGKTTFFLTACGILTPTTGSVRIHDNPVRPHRFHPDIGLVFQNPDDQLFSPTVWHDVAFGPLNLGLPDQEVRARVNEALTVTGTLGLADRAPHQLSGGEKRMVSIAGVLALHPRVVLYDEPSSSLDSGSRRRLIRFLAATTATATTTATAGTLLIASHDLRFLLEVCDRVVVVNGGRITADGAPGEVMGDTELMAANDMEALTAPVPLPRPADPADPSPAPDPLPAPAPGRAAGPGG